MESIKRQAITAMMLGMSVIALHAQDKVEATVQADLVNQYIWRGQELGEISLQPTLGLSYKGLSLTAWGNVGLSNSNDTKEFDLTLGYCVGNFNIGITDYWFNSPNERYFAYEAHKTSHVFEANIGYDFSFASLQWYTNFAGNDGTDTQGNRSYSSYVEINAPFRLAHCDWTATIGAVPYATSFYADANGFAVTNVSVKAAKDIPVTRRFSIPLFAGISVNPSTEKAYLLCGITLRP